MNDKELAQFLVRVTIADSRQVDELVMAHWRECLEGLDYDDCVTALVEHCKNSTEYLKPAHIVDRARDLRRKRAETDRRRVMKKLEQYTDQAPYMPIGNLPDMVAALDDDERFGAAVKRWSEDLMANYGFTPETLRISQ